MQRIVPPFGEVGDEEAGAQVVDGLRGVGPSSGTTLKRALWIAPESDRPTRRMPSGAAHQ